MRGFKPNFSTTENAKVHYPLGNWIKEEPLQPNNKKIELKHKKEGTEGLGEFFSLYSAGGHKEFLDMRLKTVNARGSWIYLAMFWGGLYAFIMFLMRT